MFRVNAFYQQYFYDLTAVGSDWLALVLLNEMLNDNNWLVEDETKASPILRTSILKPSYVQII